MLPPYTVGKSFRAAASGRLIGKGLEFVIFSVTHPRLVDLNPSLTEHQWGAVSWLVNPLFQLPEFEVIYIPLGALGLLGRRPRDRLRTSLRME